MLTVFWDGNGSLLLFFMPQSAIINAGCYCSTLSRLPATIRESSREYRCVLHDNSRPHVSSCDHFSVRVWTTHHTVGISFYIFSCFSSVTKFLPLFCGDSRVAMKHSQQSDGGSTVSQINSNTEAYEI